MTVWGATTDPRQLPTFTQICARTEAEVGEALDTLRSDWNPGHGPTAAQAADRREALRHLAAAQAALDRATYPAANHQHDTDDGWGT